MARKLPPLNSVRAFEAAARHLSFTLAAHELAVTQAAVSHQIKGLEERLGLRLFRRMGRQLVLTEEGQKLFPAVRDGLDTLNSAFERLIEHDASGVLNMTALPSFAAKWLVPKLGRFRALHPTIDVRLSTTVQVVDLISDDMDLGIRYGRGRWPGLDSWLLMKEDLMPVCSPALLENGPPLKTPQDLAKHTLLQDAGIDWRPWLDAAGVSDIDAGAGPGFLDSGLATQAAIEGQGVLMGRSVLVREDLAAGRLVAPFDVVLSDVMAYWMICPKGDGDRPKVRAFREWILSEAGMAEESGQVVADTFRTDFFTPGHFSSNGKPV